MKNKSIDDSSGRRVATYRNVLPRLLLAEDSQTTTALIHKYLGGSFVIVHAKDGVEAWQILQSDRKIEFVLSDIYMPRMTGQQLLVKIRRSRDPLLADLPVILMTTAGDNVDRNLAFLNGANDFLTKPTDDIEILGRINVHHKLASTIRRYKTGAREFVSTIKRSIEFLPGDKQAGMAILSYFSEIIKSKYPTLDAKITIEQ